MESNGHIVTKYLSFSTHLGSLAYCFKKTFFWFQRPGYVFFPSRVCSSQLFETDLLYEYILANYLDKITLHVYFIRFDLLAQLINIFLFLTILVVQVTVIFYCGNNWFQHPGYIYIFFSYMCNDSKAPNGDIKYNNIVICTTIMHRVKTSGIKTSLTQRVWY